jgi:hypothetical protein
MYVSVREASVEAGVATSIALTDLGTDALESDTASILRLI